nr:reverse transcriptase domain-containing protein [Tanacetum cinerariifolium]
MDTIKKTTVLLSSEELFLDEPYAFRLCSDNVMKRCIAGNEILEILAHCHSGPTGGHHSASDIGRKVYEAGFYWPSIFGDAKDYVIKCDASIRVIDMERMITTRLFMEKWTSDICPKIQNILELSKDQQSRPTSAVRNTLGTKQDPQDLGKPASDAALRKYCDRNCHQLLPIIAEKVHQEKGKQEKLKAVKARLNFEETSQHSESETPSRRRDLNKRLGSRHVRGMSGNPVPR